jgi:hypothetical protein
MRPAPADDIARLDTVLRTLRRGRDLIETAFSHEADVIEDLRDDGEEPTFRQFLMASDMAGRCALPTRRAMAIREWEQRTTLRNAPLNAAFRDFAESRISMLRSLSRRDLIDMDNLVRRFVWSEDSNCFLVGRGEAALRLFERWLHGRSFWCEPCANEYIVVILDPRGRRRRFCSTACKQAAYRQRRNMREPAR